jgi:uncharacterized protein YecT (DUF1311 family)
VSLWTRPTRTVLALLVVGCSLGRAEQDVRNPCELAKTQMDMNQCSADEFRRVDARFNAVYALLMKSLQEQTQQDGNELRQQARLAIQKLSSTEKEWIRDKDLHCDAAKINMPVTASRRRYGQIAWRRPPMTGSKRSRASPNRTIANSNRPPSA